MPPPVQLEQSDDGPKALKNRADEKAKFRSLFVLNALDMKVILADAYKEFGKVPYDLYCPSVQKSLESRICAKCRKNFATVVMLKQHVKGCHKSTVISIRPIRPRRVAAQRALELLAIIGTCENDEDAEWLNLEDVENGNGFVRDGNAAEAATSFPVVSMEEHFHSPWEENE